MPAEDSFVCNFSAGKVGSFRGDFLFKKTASYEEFLNSLADALGVIGTRKFRFADEDYGDRWVRDSDEYKEFVLYAEHVHTGIGYVRIKIE